MTLHDKRIYEICHGTDEKKSVIKYYEKDVKEALQNEFVLICQLVDKKISFNEFLDKREEIFGEGLIHSPQELTGKKGDTSPMLPVKNNEPLEVGCDGNLSSPVDTIQNSEDKK